MELQQAIMLHRLENIPASSLRSSIWVRCCSRAAMTRSPSVLARSGGRAARSSRSAQYAWRGLARRGQYRRSQVAPGTRARANPRYTNARYNLANALAEQQHWDRAAADFALSWPKIRLMPAHASIWAKCCGSGETKTLNPVSPSRCRRPPARIARLSAGRRRSAQRLRCRSSRASAVFAKPSPNSKLPCASIPVSNRRSTTCRPPARVSQGGTPMIWLRSPSLPSVRRLPGWCRGLLRTSLQGRHSVFRKSPGRRPALRS